jgi:hypothetical protein
MIRLQGSGLLGLDEWMLRIGHLKVVAEAARQEGSGLRRVKECVKQILTERVVITHERYQEIGDYLCEKRLAQVADSADEFTQDPPASLRYPDIGVLKRGNAATLVTIDGQADNKNIRIWQQDSWLASSDILSRTGAVSFEGKSGSKTGLDHVLDWALMADLIAKTGELTPEGELLANYHPLGEGSSRVNPYAVSSDRMITGFQLVSRDVDVFSRFLCHLARFTSETITKSDGARLFAAAVSELCDEADKAHYLSSGQRYAIFEHLRDLEHAARRSRDRKEPGETSTAWHRASSRLETYVDLGILKKTGSRSDCRYKYQYYRSEHFDKLVTSMEELSEPRDWIEGPFFKLFTGCNDYAAALPVDEFKEALWQIRRLLSRPRAPLPISAVSLWIAVMGAERGLGTSVTAARRLIYETAISEPALLRLSRGGHGEREEYVSVRL